jgi:hypothetical protein
MATHNKTRRHPEPSKLLIIIQVQVSPEIKLPNTPNRVARIPRFKDNAIKQQIGDVNNTTKNSHQLILKG